MPAPDTPLLFETDSSVSWPTIHLLRQHLGKHTGLVGIGIVAAVLSPVATLLPIYLVETVVDGILLGEQPFALPLLPPDTPADPFHQLVLVAGVMVVLAVIGAGTAWLGAWTWGRFAQEVQHDVRTDTYRDVQQLGLAVFEAEQTGQLVNILNDDVNQLNRLLERLLARSIELAVRFVAIVVLLFLLHWQLALVLCGVIPALGVTARYFVVRLAPKHAAVRQRVGALNARVQNTLTSIAAIKAYSGEATELARIRTSSREVYERRWAVIRTRAKFFPSMTTINWTGFGLLLVVGGYWMLFGPPLFFSRPLQMGTLVSFMLFSQQFTRPLVQGAQLIDEFYDSRASVIRIQSLRNRSGELGRTADEANTLQRAAGRVDVQGVTFGYDEAAEPTLRDVTLELPAGAFVGVVGATGSGKTTLAKLLLRFYDPDAGRILLDGVDIRTLDRQALRDQFGTVFQNPTMFTGTIRENIAYGRTDAPMAAITAAARVAHAHEFITTLPDGYETQVGERGVNLSGGQRQRIALARAVLADAPILLLDEATSHVDMATAARIRDALTDWARDRTVIAIAHRLATLRHADRILVLDDGALVETGTHEELVEADGVYAELWRLQLGERTGRIEPAD